MDWFNWAETLLGAVMVIVPDVPAWHFLFWLAGGWIGLGLVLVVYINVLGKSEEQEMRWALNAFWIYMAALTLAFVLTRASPLAALGWFIVCTVAFEVLFVNAMAVRDRWAAAPVGSWKRTLALVIGVPVFLVGFPFDVQYNLTWGRLMFLQKPRLIGDASAGSPWDWLARGDWTLTANLKRNVLDFTWQGTVARFVCRWLVEPWDKGHCGKLPA